MVPQKVNGTKLKQALDKFKSLESALEEMLKEKSTLEKDNARLKKENEQSELTRDKLSLEVNETNRKLNELKKQLDLLAKTADEYERRYKLFEGFLSMMATSPSVTNSIESAIASLQEILNSGWRSSAKPDELRTLFVRTTMGDYLKCFRCDSCGAKFIVNKEPYYTYVSNWYQCPSCHTLGQVKADDSFLKAMVTNEQMENTRRAEELQEENAILRPLKAFLGVPCEICGQPITEWSKQEVDAAISGCGWGHLKCWNSSVGQVLLVARALRKA